MEHLKHKALCCLVWVGLMWGSADAMASTRCQEHEDASVYCDDSWRGAKKFVQYLEDNRYQVEIADAFIADNLDKEAVHVWLSAPDIAPENLKNMIADGIRMLVFDESEHSLAWFRQERDKQAFSMASPYDVKAAHINGHPKLPVLEFDRKTLELRQTAGTMGEGTWHLGLNHPTPIVVSHEDEDKYIYQFSIPYREHLESSSGWIYIFRDESLPTALMMGTLQNAAILGAVMDGLCVGQVPCRLVLYERDADYLAPQEDQGRMIRQWADNMRTIWEDKVQSASAFFQTRQQALERMPWGFLVLAFMALWYVISIVISVPLGRDK